MHWRLAVAGLGWIALLPWVREPGLRVLMALVVYVLATLWVLKMAPESSDE